MFLTFDTVFPDRGSEHDIPAFYRVRVPASRSPRTGWPTSRRHRLVWTTFMPSQVDLDVANDRAPAPTCARVLATLRATAA
ncbi:hypothetical protein ACRAWD_21895 [Caulobacter segnis]